LRTTTRFDPLARWRSSRADGTLQTGACREDPAQRSGARAIRAGAGLRGRELSCDHNAPHDGPLWPRGAPPRFRMLLQRNPFAGINGSGKHCNWSLATRRGRSSWSRAHGRTRISGSWPFRGGGQGRGRPRRRIRASWLPPRTTTVGANEAPPAILTPVSGGEMSQILRHIESGSLVADQPGKRAPNLGVSKLPGSPGTTPTEPDVPRSRLRGTSSNSARGRVDEHGGAGLGSERGRSRRVRGTVRPFGKIAPESQGARHRGSGT